MAHTIFTQKSTCLAVGTVLRCHASKVDHPTTHHLRFNAKVNYNRFSFPDQSQGLRSQNEATRKKNMTICASIPPETPVPVDPNSPGLWELITNSSVSDWKLWIAGSIVTVLLSFVTKGKWGPLLQLQDKIQTTIDEAEKVVDMVEDVAERVEKVAEEAAKNLPEGKLQDAAEYVEKLAEKVDKSAEMAEAALEKIEDMGEKLESFVESTQELKTATTVQTKDQN